MTSTVTRWVFFSIGLAFLVGGCLPFATLDSFDDPSLLRPAGFLFQVMGVSLCWGFFPLADSRSTKSFFLILTVSILLRAVLWPTPPTDDIHRYRWEGNLVLSGENPFRIPADDESLRALRDADWEQMNHKDRTTVYPPLAQLLFAGMAGASDSSPLAIEKTVFVAADIGTLLLILGLLRRRGLPSSFALLYSLNPIVLLSFAGEGHYDSVFVFLLVASAYSLETGRTRWSWLLLAASIQIKLISLVLIPIWLSKRAFRGAWLLPLVIALTWLPFLQEINTWLTSLFAFGGQTSFQGIIPLLLRATSLPIDLAAPIGGGLGLLALGYIYWKGGDPSTMIRRSLQALILFSPILHFWYLSWLVPFLALRPSMSWIWLCASQALYFLVWVQLDSTGSWGLPTWAEWIVWGPFLLLGLLEWNRFRRYRRLSQRSNSPDRQTVGLVIPTYQAAESLPECLESIRRGTSLPDQWIIADGGSTDNTLEIAKTNGVPLSQAPLGRGAQIKAGIEALSTDWVLVLHADCLLHPQAIAQIRNLGPEVVGGSCGQRFQPGTPVLTLVEFMNEGRAMIGESYWGDQGMFFRKELRSVWAPLDQFPLMEDVELSRLLRRQGETRYLGLETRAGTAKWKTGNRINRFALVFGTVIRFRLATIFGRQAAISGELYRRYYGK